MQAGYGWRNHVGLICFWHRFSNGRSIALHLLLKQSQQPYRASGCGTREGWKRSVGSWNLGRAFMICWY